MTFFAPFLLILTILTPGLAIWLILNRYGRLKLTGVESVFLCLLGGTAVTSWLSLTLAEFGRFSLPLLLALLLLPGLFAIGWAARHGRLRQAVAGLSWHWQDALVGLLLLAAVFLSGRPSEYIIGGRDHGVYVNTGIHIAKTGSILVEDAVITAVPPELRATLVWPETRPYQAGFPGPWSEGQRMSGLTIRDTAAGIYLPHAFHLYPALIAVFFVAGGVEMALFATLFLALLGSLSIYVVTTRLWGTMVGGLTLLLLTFSVTQVWFSGYPTAEIMVQVLFWGGLFALILLLEGGGTGTAVLAGACLGLLHLAKLDTVLVPVMMSIVLLILWLRGAFRPAYWWGIGAYLLLSFQALLHASTIATIYFLDHAVRNLLPSFVAEPLVAAADGYPYPADWIGRFMAANWPMLLLGSLAILAGLVLLRWLRSPLQRPLATFFQRSPRLQQGIVGVVLVVMVGTAVSDQFFPTPAMAGTMQAVQLARLYLTRLGLLAGLAGWLLLLYQANSLPKSVTLFLLLGNIAPLYVLGAGTSLDHFWVVRRFLPLAFPAFLLAMAYLINGLWDFRLKQWAQGRWLMMGTAVTLLALILAGFGQHLRYIAGVVEYDGLTEQLETLAEQLPEEAILLIQTGTPAQQFSLPLWFLFDKQVFAIRGEVREDRRLETAVAHWQNEGRPVYWLATAETLPPTWPGWQPQHQFSYLIDVPQMETPFDHIPHQVQQLHVPLDIFLLTQTEVR